jgi:hypothetical protein
VGVADLVLVLVLFGVGVLWWGAIAAMRARSRREQAGLVRLAAMCGQCRYPRDGLADNAACPECGTEPASTPPLATQPPRASGRLAWVPFAAMITCAAGAMAVGNITYIGYVLWGAAGGLLPACVIALILGLRRIATTRVLLGLLCASACVTLGLAMMISVEHAKIRRPNGYEVFATASMWVMGLLAVPLLTCLWEGAVVIWSQRRPKP